MKLKLSLRQFRVPSRAIIIALFALSGIVLYLTVGRTVTVNPLSEERAMLRLEQTKRVVARTPFTTDGCSGHVSELWRKTIKELKKNIPSVAVRYQDVDRIPFEEACIEHDRRYHEGAGGYAGRLRADNALRNAIINYALNHTETIKRRTGIASDAAVLFLYEHIADVMYRAVRVGGAPCTGQPYAWGYGYGGGACIAEDKPRP